MDSRAQGSRLPRGKCDLCKQEIVWVEHDRRKIPINPNPVTSHSDGEFKRVGATNKVEKVPEAERWMHARLYQGHRDTCQPWLQCRADGIRTFKECQERMKPRPRMTQNAREDLEPEMYKVRKDL